MSPTRRSTALGPLGRWAGDSPSRRLAVWLLRHVVSLLVLAVGVAVILFVLVPNMIDGVTKILSR
jgi:hypothetical protein